MIIYFEHGEMQKKQLRDLFGLQNRTDLCLHFGKIEDTECYWYNISGEIMKEQGSFRSRKHLKFVTEIAI